MSSNKKLKKKIRTSQLSETLKDEMKDFIEGDELSYGYEGSSDSNDVHANNGANQEDAPQIVEKKVEMKISQMKINEIFNDEEESSDSDQELQELLAKKKENDMRKNMLVEEMLDISKYNEIMSNSQAKIKPLAPATVKKSPIELPNIVLTAQQIQTKFKELPDELKIFITEVYENHSDKRKLFMFGITEAGARITVQVNDTNKCIYFIMREGEGETNEQKIENEIRDRLKQSGIDEFEGQLMRMQYVFEIEGIPRGNILVYRVRYPFSLELKNPPKPDWEGKTFKYIIGTTYTSLELFIVKNKIKGPQWISLQKKYLQVNTKLQGTVGLPLELFVPDDVQTPSQAIKIPKVRVVSFAVKVTKPADVKKNNIFPSSAQRDKPIIYAISLQYHPNYNVESKMKNFGLQSIMFCLSSLGPIPHVIKNAKVVKCETELQLLSRFFETIEGFDPDVLVCHDATMALDTIISRADQLNIKEKARLGRLGANRTIPTTLNMKQRQMLILAGRLLVDTYVHAKDILKSVDYSLAFLSKQVVFGKMIQEIRSDQANAMLATGDWMKLLLHCNEESEGVFHLMNHLEILQLTRQLTNICGNLWRRSLDNARAERNEYLMMHVCEQEKIIIPDKFYREKDVDEEAKKEKYEGGYVIEPEKDLYTEFILLLDFNSLYPSIIRQYNICFSKVRRNLLSLKYYYRPRAQGKTEGKREGDHQNNKSSSKKFRQERDEKKMILEQEGEEINQREQYGDRSKIKVEPVAQEFRNSKNWGFLPRLINAIVLKRSEFKKKMVNLASLPTLEFEKRHDEYMAFEITQKSYKLVANSIYGCLGFENSRFYARDLAALITEKGRDALKRAKELVEKSGKATVIYGDTDSLMIKIDMQEDWSEVQKIRHINLIAERLKIDINKEYTNRMLEIDVDGVFKPLNLIAKKKYMAKKLTNFDKVRKDGVEPQYTVEYKGIEVAKRDGCERSRSAIRDIFDIVLNNMTNIEDAKTLIYNYFEKLHEEMQNIDPQKQYKNYLLAKQLNKHPSQYKNGAENLPHIRVAKKMIENGEKAQKLVNHAIYYLIVQSTNEKASVAERAVDENSFLRSLKTTTPMKLDINYYKVHQILPPIIRILVNIKSMDVSYIKQKFKIPKSLHHQVDKIERQDLMFENDDNVHQYIVRSKDLDISINNALGELICPSSDCLKRYPICKNGILTTRCMNQNCDFTREDSFYPIISNIISGYMFLRVTNFNVPEYKCKKCSKVWKVQIRECCPQSKFQQNYNISELHNIMYSISKVLNPKQTKLEQGNANNKGGLAKLRNMVEKFLKNSSFEKVSKRFMTRVKFAK